ncbi:putative tensin [Fasciolopsis buskii]|uniref:Putative tensin n=1 Tax=Fasciolopsis buskii TaxID=27845 RepID=A0A8E0RLZ6_9TREM|nr:putative tensin [Fasciolopsis buski]
MFFIRFCLQISEPLRPDELNQVLARYGLFDEQALPSAWIAPYPLPTSIAARRPVRTFPASVNGGVQPTEIATVPRDYSVSPHGVRTSGQPVPSSSLIGQQPTTHRPRELVGRGGEMDSFMGIRDRGRDVTDHTIAPLAYSLSAELASVGKHRFRLTYVTDRLLVVSYPPDAQEADHNEGARWLCHAFERRYGSNYRIFNLSGFTKELHLSSQVPVIDLFWPAPLAPGLEQLVTAIDQLDFWLHNHDSNGYHYGVGQDRRTPEIDPATNRVAVLHCTGPRSLLATYLAVYICQSKARFGPLCGQRPGSPTARGLQWNERRFRRQV